MLIINDSQAQFKEPAIVKTLQKIITKIRHLRCTIFLLQQNYQALQKPLRELVSNLVIFNIGKLQLSRIFEEAMQLNKDRYEKLIQICFVDPHDWILINFHRSKNIYRNFDLIDFGQD